MRAVTCFAVVCYPSLFGRLDAVPALHRREQEAQEEAARIEAELEVARRLEAEEQAAAERARVAEKERGQKKAEGRRRKAEKKARKAAEAAKESKHGIGADNKGREFCH